MSQNHSITRETGTNGNWVEMFDEYGVQFLILARHDDGDMLNLFQSQPGWALDFQDEEAVIFARADIPSNSQSSIPNPQLAYLSHS